MDSFQIASQEDFEDTDTLIDSLPQPNTTTSWFNFSSSTTYSSIVSALYIPAAFGIWSWPVLLNLLIGSGASASSIMFSHYVAFYLTLLLGGLSMYLLIKDHPRGIGPIFLTMFALPLVMINPTINLMQDNGTIASNTELNTLLNVVTWIGVLEMTFASGWNSSMDQKVANKIKTCARRR